MSLPNRIMKYYIYGLTLCIIAYLLAAFYAVSFNISYWSTNERGVLISIWSIVILSTLASKFCEDYD